MNLDRIKAIFDEELEQMAHDQEPSFRMEWLKNLRDKVVGEVSRTDSRPIG